MSNYRKKYKEHYGIEFGKDYVVHHIDHNRDNNDISNLILLPRKLHIQYHNAVADCIHAGLGASINMSEFKLTPWHLNSLMYFNYFYSQIENLFTPVQYWVEQKARADRNDECAYRVFKSEQ